MASSDSELFDKVVNLCNAEASCFPQRKFTEAFAAPTTTGPLGVLMLRNVKDAWWRSMVQLRSDVVGLDAAILSPPQVWEASGHLEKPVTRSSIAQNANPAQKINEKTPTYVPRVAIGHLHRSACLQPHVQDTSWPSRRRWSRCVPASRNCARNVHQLQKHS